MLFYGERTASGVARAHQVLSLGIQVSFQVLEASHLQSPPLHGAETKVASRFFSFFREGGGPLEHQRGPFSFFRLATGGLGEKTVGLGWSSSSRLPRSARARCF